MNANDVLLNKAFCFPINTPKDNVIELVGDVTKKYDDLHHVFKRNGQWYCVPERDKNGTWSHTIPWVKFLQYNDYFKGEFKPISELPVEDEKSI